MKIIPKITILIIVTAILTPGCRYFSQRLDKDSTHIDYNAPDFTGVIPYYQDGRLIKEETMVDGVKHGPTTTYYSGTSKVRQIINYKDGLQHGTSKWFYEDGSLFRSTPYVDGQIHGEQVQYYRNGNPKAKLRFENGLRVARIEEYNERSQRQINRNEEIIITVNDDYSAGLVYSIYASLTNKNRPVTWYRGDLVDGRLFDPDKVRRIYTNENIGIIQLQKSSGTNPGYVGVIAQIITPFGNREYHYKRVPVPYRDIY